MSFKIKKHLFQEQQRLVGPNIEHEPQLLNMKQKENRS